MSRRAAYALVVAAAALPRLGALLAERGEILAEFTEKSDDFARTLAASGTFGFLPGEPSAYTQPLYGWFLAAIYWGLGRSWPAVGLVQIAVAVGTALLVLEIGRRTLGLRWGLAAAVVATLNPYLVWHDVHVNREVVDGLLAAALVLATLAAVERRSPAFGALAGGVAGLAVLGNARLALVPVLLAAFLAWRRAPVAGALALAAAALVVAPWVARNAVALGCATVTSDARALWKANNPATLETLAAGGWIDDVPPLPGAPPTPEEAAALERQTGREVAVDECAQQSLYRDAVLEFWREQPGEKARLAAQAAGMLWDPRVTRTEGRAGAGSFQDVARTWIEAAYLIPLYVLALAGAVVAPPRLAVLAVGLLGYVTATALVFAGATRYRAPWDFLLALLAAAALAAWLERRRRPR